MQILLHNTLSHSYIKITTGNDTFSKYNPYISLKNALIKIIPY